MMRFQILLAILLLVLSCKESPEDKECSCNDINLAISYSIGYSKDSLYAIVCASDASNNVPQYSTIAIAFNGGLLNDAIGNCYYYNKNGKYSLNLSIILPNGIKCSKVEEFEIKGLK